MMKQKFLCLAAAFALVAGAVAQDAAKDKPEPGSVAYLDALNGFRSVAFGTDFSKFSGLKIDQDHGKLKLYKKDGEKLSIGLAKLTDIVYHFFDDKFYGVSLHAGDASSADTLRAIAFSGFGVGQKQDDHNTLWEGNTAWAHFSDNPQTGEGTLFIGNNEISLKLGEYEQKAALEAAAEL